MPNTEPTQPNTPPDKNICPGIMVAMPRNFAEPHVLLNVSEGIAPQPFNLNYWQTRFEHKAPISKK